MADLPKLPRRPAMPTRSHPRARGERDVAGVEPLGTRPSTGSATGLEQMQARQGDEAVDTFSEIIRRRPEFAEGWNKRATVYYLLGEYKKSLADCDEVMKRNPYHFGALSGYGMIYMQLDQPATALEYFEQALRVNPNLESTRQTIEILKTLLIQRRKDTI
jgi:tetratricopeptide (TPR) repeat protein